MRKLLSTLTMLLPLCATANDSCLASLESAIEINRKKIDTTVREFSKNYIDQYGDLFDENTLDIFLDNAIKGHFEVKEKAVNLNNYLSLLINIEEGRATANQVSDILGSDVNTEAILNTESVCKSVADLKSEIQALEVEYKMSSSSLKKKKVTEKFTANESEIVVYPINLASAMNCYGVDYGSTLFPCIIEDLSVSPLRIKAKSEL